MAQIKRSERFKEKCKKLILSGLSVTETAKRMKCSRCTVDCAVGKEFLIYIKAFRKTPEYVRLIFSKNKIENPITGCMEWTGSLDMHGYGIVGFRSVPWRVHRLSYFIHYEDFDKSKNICHSCDNPKCFNPDHLFIGTIQDNIMDKCKKGRAPAKLTHSQVLEIRQLRCKDGRPLKELAKKYAVSHSTISLIALGKAFKYL